MIIPIVLGIAYLSVPIINRIRFGCPLFSDKIIDINGTKVVACKSIDIQTLLFWPLGLLFQQNRI